MKNYFIDRSKKGKKVIIAAYARPQRKSHKFLSEDNQEMIDFLGQQAFVISNAKKNRRKVDKKVRQNVIDDLIAKNELPSDYIE